MTAQRQVHPDVAVLTRVDRARPLRVLGHGSADAVGRYSWRLRDDTWSWSPQLYALYGYPDRTLSPTSERWLAQLSGADQSEGEHLQTELRRGLRSFSWCHPLTTAAGRTRIVVESGWVLGADLDTAVCHGLVNDISKQVDAVATRAVEASAAHRQQINQAQGALMLSYGLPPETALNLLIGYSQHHNVKLAVLAERLIEATHGPDRDPAPGEARTMDRLLHHAATRPRQPHT